MVSLQVYYAIKLGDKALAGKKLWKLTPLKINSLVMLLRVVSAMLPHFVKWSLGVANVILFSENLYRLAFASAERCVFIDFIHVFILSICLSHIKLAWLGAQKCEKYLLTMQHASEHGRGVSTHTQSMLRENKHWKKFANDCRNPLSHRSVRKLVKIKLVKSITYLKFIDKNVTQRYTLLDKCI